MRFTAVLLTALFLALGAAPEERVIESFDGDGLPPGVSVSNATAKRVRAEDGRALRLRVSEGAGPRISFDPDRDGWDWTGMAGVAVDVTSEAKKPMKVILRARSEDDGGKRQTATCAVPLPADAPTTLKLFFDNYAAGPYWGMRGIPVYGPLSLGGPTTSTFAIERRHVTQFEISFPELEDACEIVIDNVRVFTADSPLNTLTPFPFIDRYGQYMHDEWPGKVHGDADFAAQRDEEEQRLRQAPAMPDRDRFGGWVKGPQLEATGWFRTEKVDGKWWLVTPEGHVFFSLGVDTIYSGHATFIEGRETWFESEPWTEEAFKAFAGYTSGTHSMAESIGGKGRNFSFYSANLKRKYGDGWEDAWRDMVYRRLNAWGFNTLGNWTADRVRSSSPVPYVVTAGTGSYRCVEGGGGFWGKMIDVFDESFAPMSEERIAGAAKGHADNPMCLGYFVDNEQSWNGIASGTLNSPPDQPCRKVFLVDLQAKYGTLDALNAAWKTDAAEWDALRAPKSRTDACAEDMNAFEYKFAKRYFDTVAALLDKYAPNQLYLGCRFAVGPRPVHILKACAEAVDVLSINQYATDVGCEDWTGDSDVGKPIIIGEFHFGALDRGMFHQGLVSAADQQDRGVQYARYVESVAKCPAFVGCHWFEYVDEPTTGRSMDGENFNIGLVSGVDRPYYEMLDTMTRVNASIYATRCGR